MVLLLGLVGLLLLWMLSKLLKLSFKVFWFLLVNGILGVILLTLTNIAANFLNMGFEIRIDPLSAVLAGVLGLPYVVFRLIMKFLG